MRASPRRSLLTLLLASVVCTGPSVAHAEAGPSASHAAGSAPAQGCPIAGSVVEVHPAKKAHGAPEVGASVTITGLPGYRAGSVSWSGRLNRDRHPDLLVSLPDCGSRGECLQLVLVGCAAVHRHVVASPVDYVYRWRPGPRRPDGWRTLVETERGGSAMVDDSSDVTWRFSGGRYRRGTKKRLVRLLRAWGDWSDVPAVPARRPPPPRSLRQLCHHARCVGRAGSPVRAFVRKGSTRVGIAWRQGHSLHVVEEATDPPAAQLVRPVELVMPTVRVRRHPPSVTAVVQVAEKVGGRAREVRFECHGAGVAPRCSIQRRFDAGR